MKKLCISISLLAGIVACSPKSFAPASEQLSDMQQKVPGITLEDAKEGYQLYAAKCSGCHHLHSPDKYTIAQWNSILPKMYPKAKVSDEERKLISDYLHALSK